VSQAWASCSGDAELLAAGGVLGLVGAYRQQDRRQAMGERAEEAARAAVRDDRAAARQDLGLGEVALEPHVRRLRPELRGIEVAPGRRDDVDRQLAQPGEHALEEVAGLEVEDRAEGEVDGVRVGLRAGGVHRAEHVGATRERAKAAREGGEHHGLARPVRRQAVLGAQGRERLGDDLRANECLRGADEYDRESKARALGGDHGAEVDLAARQHVRTPRGADVEHAHRPLARDAPSEPVAQDRLLASEIDVEQQRPRRRRLGSGRPGHEHLESELPYPASHRWPPTERDHMSCVSHRPRDRYEWLQVAAATGEREERPHVSSQ
jgi:hypothetical protein